MRVGLRRSEYFERPLEKGDLTSITGDPLHKDILDVWNIGQRRRDSDILRTMETNDFSKSYSTGRIPILKSDKVISSEKLNKELNRKVKILIACIEDTEARCAAMEYLEDIDSDTILLEQLCDDLISCQSVVTEM